MKRAGWLHRLLGCPAPDAAREDVGWACPTCGRSWVSEYDTVAIDSGSMVTTGEIGWRRT